MEVDVIPSNRINLLISLQLRNDPQMHIPQLLLMVSHPLLGHQPTVLIIQIPRIKRERIIHLLHTTNGIGIERRRAVLEVQQHSEVPNPRSVVDLSHKPAHDLVKGLPDLLLRHKNAEVEVVVREVALLNLLEVSFWDSVFVGEVDLGVENWEVRERGVLFRADLVSLEVFDPGYEVFGALGVGVGLVEGEEVVGVVEVFVKLPGV